VQASILGSDEFFSRVGGDASSFLNALYGAELGRAADSGGQQFWTPLTGDVAGRTQIARRVEASPEATQRVVATIYQDTLGRAPDGGGLAYWAGQLQQGTSQTTVLAGVLGSNEFFSRMQSYAAGLNTSDPNVAAATFISEAHVFQSQPPMVPAGPRPPGAPGQPAEQDVTGNVGGSDSFPIDSPFYMPVPIDTTNYGNAIVDTSTPVMDTAWMNTSSTDSTDYTQSPDCGCDSTDYSVDPIDTGTPDTSGFSIDTI
jgi:hypothetical protein